MKTIQDFMQFLNANRGKTWYDATKMMTQDEWEVAYNWRWAVEENTTRLFPTCNIDTVTNLIKELGKLIGEQDALDYITRVFNDM